MLQNETDKVVNRFLLSTLYCFIGAVLLYYLYKSSISTATVLIMPAVFISMFAVSILLAAWFGIRYWMLKKGTLYYFGMFIIIGLLSIFLQYYPKIQLFFFTYKRFVFVGAVIGLVYLYEFIYYFAKTSLLKNKNKGR